MGPILSGRSLLAGIATHRPRRTARAGRLAGAAALAISVALVTAASSSALTAPTPANTSAPTLSGTPAVGQTLTCAPGTWSGNPSGFSYSWLRNGVPIAGQSGSTYVVQSADQGHSISCAVTAANIGGEYTISGLASASYKVSFEPFEGNYLFQYYSGQPSSTTATPVSVSAPSATTGIDAEVRPGGQIAGKVSAASTHVGLANLEVCADKEGGESVHRCAVTNAGGEYVISGLPTAVYEVQVETFTCSESGCTRLNYLEQPRTGVTVTAPETVSGTELELQTAGQIAGEVTNAGSNPVANVEVCAVEESKFFISCAFTNSAGGYTISGLPEGHAYEVSFNAYEGNYAPRYYNEQATRAAAALVSVTVGKETKDIDAKMQTGGQITGQVTDASGAPLERVEACVEAEGSEVFFGCASTESTGTYTISGLPTGSFKVSFHATYGSNYLPRFYNEKANFTEAESVSVTAGGAEKTGINAKMQAGGQIAGKVTAASTHAAIANVEVCVVDYSCTDSNASGEYTISGLPTGSSYEVSFYAEEGNYLPQYYSDQPTAATANPVSTTAGSTTAGIDAELQPGGQITGRVIDAATHVGMANVSVCAYPPEAGELFGGCATTNSAGSSASATSSALAVPAPNSKFTVGKAKFDSKTGNLTFTVNLANAGKLSWSLFFRNSDVGFADSLAISAATEGAPIAQSAGRKGKGRSKKCAKGEVKHKGKCVRSLVPFASGSQNASSPGAVQVKVHASAKAIKALKAGHTLHVSGTFTFQSALGGTAVTQTISTVVKAPTSKSKHHGKHGH